MDELLITALKASIEAGITIRAIYESGDINTQLKEDKTPVTNADLASNNIINDHLKPTGIPVLSEENRSIPYSERKDWYQLWIVDPLDGTKEFIKRNGEFTVNIALVKNHIPELGVIFAPVTGELYFGSKGMGSFKTEIDKSENDIRLIIESAKKIPPENQEPVRKVVVSRSHMNKATEEYIHERSSHNGYYSFVSRGSSLKICMVAEGAATYYPRFGPTMEWDTAAGHAIIRNAGKRIVEIATGEEIRYNKENLVNPDFIVE